MRLIDADTLHIAIIEKGQANERGKYIVGDIWELTGAEIGEVIDSQPTINPEPNWIPVTERLPEGIGRVIAQMDGGAIHDVFYKGKNPYGHVVWVRLDDCIYWDNEVVAWMPLPEPYKGGDDNMTHCDECAMKPCCVVRLNDNTVTGCNILLLHRGLISKEEFATEHTDRGVTE